MKNLQKILASGIIISALALSGCSKKNEEIYDNTKIVNEYKQVEGADSIRYTDTSTIYNPESSDAPRFDGQVR